MNTKEAIEFIKTFKEVVTSIDIENGEGKAIEEYNDKIDKVIGFLQHGEKYEAIVRELENCLLPEQYKIVEILEQKYFPDFICGNCKEYDSDTLFCAEHPEYGELVEQDTCSDWKEDE